MLILHDKLTQYIDPARQVAIDHLGHCFGNNSLLFCGINSYGLGKKAHTSRFFSLFCGEIVIIICFILAVAIKNLALRWNNKELATGKSAVWFEQIS